MQMSLSRWCEAAAAPTPSWQAGAKLPSSPMSPSTAMRRPATSVAAKVASEARMESGLAL